MVTMMVAMMTTMKTMVVMLMTMMVIMIMITMVMMVVALMLSDVQANDDLRQEQFVSHLVAVFDQIFKAAKLGVRLRPYEIMATSLTAGVIEVGTTGQQQRFKIRVNRHSKVGTTHV